jgi:hypothetical protein
VLTSLSLCPESVINLTVVCERRRRVPCSSDSACGPSDPPLFSASMRIISSSTNQREFISSRGRNHDLLALVYIVN